MERPCPVIPSSWNNSEYNVGSSEGPPSAHLTSGESLTVTREMRNTGKLQKERANSTSKWILITKETVARDLTQQL